MEQYFKYSRTYHFPWSLGSTSDDKFIRDIGCFLGLNTVTTEKMDGENTSIYSDKFHARSLDSKHHDSRNWVKGLWGQIKHEIPDGWRICGENMYAKHSLYYEDLESYFLVFSIWNEKNECLSWNDTLDICDILGLATVPVINVGPFDEGYLRNLANTMDISKKEGYVVRNAGTFHYDDFSKNVAKYVRPEHVTTSEHWMSQKIEPNGLKKN